MKKLIIGSILAATMVVSGYSQTVFLKNIGTDNVASQSLNIPVFNVGGANTVIGAAFKVQLYHAPSTASTSTDMATFIAAGVPESFLLAPGLFSVGTAVSLTGYAAGNTPNVQVRAWELATGSTWETATTRGQSAIFQVGALGGGINPAVPSLFGMSSFSLAVVPEPTTIALGLIGAAGLAMRRRRNK